MKFAKKQYVRYWDGGGVCYGQVVDRSGNDYDVRVGGTDTVVTVKESRMSLHPALVAAGRMLGDWSIYRKNPDTSRYLYHVGAYENLTSIVSQKGLRPRSEIDWGSMGGDVYTGAEASAGRVKDVHVDIASYLKSEAKDGSLFLGDIGEFLYVTSARDLLINYLEEVVKKGKTGLVFRFKTPKHLVWYEDVRSSAIKTMGRVPLTACEVLLVDSSLVKKILKFDYDAESVLEGKIKGDDDWVSCASKDWKSSVDLEYRFSKLTL